MKICREDHDVRSNEARRSPALAWSDEMKARITSNLRWEDGTELFEYMCQQANQAYTLMVGEGTSVDRTTLAVENQQRCRSLAQATASPLSPCNR